MNIHEIVEKNVGLLVVFILVAISFGAMVEITPLMFQKHSLLDLKLYQLF